MSVCPKALGHLDFGGVVDEEEGLVVGGVGGAPPVHEGVDVALGEGALNVVCPGQAIALSAGGIVGVPFIVDRIES